MDIPDRSLINAMVAVSSGLELGATLERIVRAAADVVDAQYAAMGVLGGGQTLGEFISVGLSDDQVRAIGDLPTGRGLLGHLIDHPTALRLDDLAEHSASFGFPSGHPPMRSFLGVPVRVRGVVFGNLYLTEKRGGVPFTERDEQMVTALASAAGVAIENARLFERTRGRERWQRAVTEIDNAVLAGAEAGEVLTLVAARSRRLADADVAFVCLPEGDAGLVVEIVDSRVSRIDPAVLTGRAVPPTSIVAEVFTTGHVRVGQRIGIGPDGTSWNGPVVALPLRTPNRVLGTLVLVRAEGSVTFTPEALELAEAFATQAAVTLVLAESRLERERLAVFEDRDRIGRDLHDLVIQRLFATGVQLQRAARSEGVPTDVVDRINSAVDDLDATVKEIRQTIFALQAADASVGVRSRVLHEVASATPGLGFAPTVHFTGTIDAQVSDRTADHLVAALREALSNASRHAHASSVSVAVVVDASSVELTVTDDGRGFEPGGRRSGLANLATRATESNGVCEVFSGAGEGTRLVWRAPLGSLP